jgi:hypothetical protein
MYIQMNSIYLTLLLFYYSGQALLHDQSLFISNLVNGADQYALPSMEHVKTFLYNIFQNYPLHIAIAKDCGWLVLGGDDGFTHVFDLWKGTFVQRLDHRDGTIVLFPNLCFLMICSWRPRSDSDSKHHLCSVHQCAQIMIFY